VHPEQILDRQEALVVEMSALLRSMRAALPLTDKSPSSLPNKRVAPRLVGTHWNKRIARGSVGVLLRYAAMRKKLTYTELHNELVGAGAERDIGMMQKYALPLDHVCLALADTGGIGGHVVPLLTVLVINKRSLQPSPGLNRHLKAWLDAIGRTETAATVDLTSQASLELIDFATKAVFDFTDWDAVLAAIGLSGDPATDMGRAL